MALSKNWKWSILSLRSLSIIEYVPLSVGEHSKYRQNDLAQINTYILGQDEHQALLRDLILNEFGCSVELRTQLVSFEQQPDQNSVITRLIKTDSDSEEAVEEVASFSWVVGADGAHSTIRKQLGLSFLGQSHDVDLAVGDIEVEGLDPNVRHLVILQAPPKAHHRLLFYLVLGCLGRYNE
jgi:2-polyprenyl-6-methoxyphenol hydroxylase-like FAD-dependent oxidoreductase